MQKQKEYNNLSPQLKKFLPKLKPNERIRFQLNSVYMDKVTKKLVCPASFSIGNTDRIYDPWANPIEGTKPQQYEGGYVDLAYILRERPAPSDSPKDSILEFGRVEFLRTNAGIIEIIGGNREQEKLLMVLFFGNKNSTNIGKDWFVKPNGKAIYHQIETTKKAKSDLGLELKIDRAKGIITDMSEEEVKQSAAGLIPSTYHHLSIEEQVLELRKIAAINPDKIIGLSKNVDVKTTAFIEECLKAGIIEIDKKKSQFVYGDDKSEICSIKSGSTPHNSLKKYFMTDDGVEVLESLEKQLELSKKTNKDKTTKAVV